MRSSLSLLMISSALAAANPAEAHRDPTAFEPETGTSVALGFGLGPTYGWGGYALEIEKTGEARNGVSAHAAVNGLGVTVGGHYWFAGRRLQLGLGVAGMSRTSLGGGSSVVVDYPGGGGGQPAREDQPGEGNPGGNGGSCGNGGGGGADPCPDPAPPTAVGGPGNGGPNGPQDEWGALGSSIFDDIDVAFDIMLDHDIGRPGRWGMRYGMGWFVRGGGFMQGIPVPSFAMSRKF